MIYLHRSVGKSQELETFSEIARTVRKVIYFLAKCQHRRERVYHPLLFSGP